MNEVLRYEKKYRLSYDEFRRYDHLFSQVMHGDPHNGNFGYMVRSLYFDTPDEKDFYEKQDGLELRRKIRLRIYDPDNDFAVLEMKQKQGNLQKKRSLRVNREDAMKITDGRYDCLLSYKENFAAELYAYMNLHCYRPKTIVEYHRKAFIAKENKIRITFDSQIEATESDFNVFNPHLNMYPVLDRYIVVLEVKYNDFLLSYIKDLVSTVSKSQVSVSKYALARSISMHV